MKRAIREVKHDVYGKRQTAKMKLSLSVFSSLYSRIKTFVFAVNSKRHFFYFCVICSRITRKGQKFRGNLCRLPSAVNVMLKLSIICCTICVQSATQHNIHMYPDLLFAAIHYLKSTPTFSVQLRSLVSRTKVDVIRSWVRTQPRSKDIFLCLMLFPDFLYLAG